MNDIDITTLTQLIGSLGFPIVCCMALFWYMIKQNKAKEEEREAHKQEISELKEAINNNSLVMQKLIDKLDADKDVNENA